jgi:hypothetical protein
VTRPSVGRIPIGALRCLGRERHDRAPAISGRTVINMPIQVRRQICRDIEPVWLLLTRGIRQRVVRVSSPDSSPKAFRRRTRHGDRVVAEPRASHEGPQQARQIFLGAPRPEFAGHSPGCPGVVQPDPVPALFDPVLKGGASIFRGGGSGARSSGYGWGAGKPAKTAPGSPSHTIWPR